MKKLTPGRYPVQKKSSIPEISPVLLYGVGGIYGEIGIVKKYEIFQKRTISTQNLYIFCKTKVVEILGNRIIILFEH